nr:MAG TPA: hypothetical protein [Caudoviricetes sp.]
MDRKLYEAAKTVKEYCAGRSSCEDCPFNVGSFEAGYIGCYDRYPQDWDIEHLEQEVEEDA